MFKKGKRIIKGMYRVKRSIERLLVVVFIIVGFKIYILINF